MQIVDSPVIPAAAVKPEFSPAMSEQLAGREVLAWSEHDLDEAGRFAKRHAALTDEALYVESPEPRRWPLESLKSIKTNEGVGADRLRITPRDGEAFDLRYTRRFRRDMTRLRRKVARRLPDDAADAKPRPAWLDAVERAAEQQELCPKCGQMIPAYAEGVCPNCLQQKSILWRLLDVAKPYRSTISFALGVTLVHAMLTPLPGVFQKHLVDDAINSELSVNVRLRSLAIWASAFIGIIIVSEILGGIRMSTLSQVGTKVTRDLRHRVYTHLHELSLRFFSKRRTGSLITRVTNDTERLWDFIVFGSVNVIRDVLMIICITTIMLWMNWRLALIAIAPLPVVAMMTYWRGKTMHGIFTRLWGHWSRLSAIVGDSLAGVKVVKAFAAEGQEADRFDVRNREYTEKEQAVNRTWWKLQPLVSGVMRIAMLSVWVVGGYWVIAHPSKANSLGTLVSFTFFVGQFYGPINELANSARMVTRAASSAQRVFEVLDTPPELYNRSDALAPAQMLGEVEFRHVSFSYEGAAPALRDVSILAKPGQMIGLCGHSGAGKSTFVNLISRFYDVTDGQLLVDGRDVRDYDLEWLRRNIGVVLQEPYLFQGTIADNIRYGAPQSSDVDVMNAARAANAHDFIVGLADGYDTIVGERGQSLSGGERQRVSIARAILHNPRVLILDEATSSVDTETEKQIQQALTRLVAGRTTFAIAHRLSTLRAADQLVVLEKGRIAETGTHDSLVETADGVYAKLYRTQSELSASVALR